MLFLMNIATNSFFWHHFKTQLDDSKLPNWSLRPNCWQETARTSWPHFYVGHIGGHQPPRNLRLIYLRTYVRTYIPFHSIPFHCMALHCMAWHGMQCNAMQCNAMQCNANESKAKQCNAMQCMHTYTHTHIHTYTHTHTYIYIYICI